MKNHAWSIEKLFFVEKKSCCFYWKNIEKDVFYPYHFEVSWVGDMPGPNKGLTLLVFQLPSVVSIQIDFQNLEVVVLSHSHLSDLHDYEIPDAIYFIFTCDLNKCFFSQTATPTFRLTFSIEYISLGLELFFL